MTSESSDESRAVAIDQLEALGLSTYAARTFVALVSLGSGTAKDVSDVADVPRTRVYDAVDELHDRGLADVQHSNPKRFWVVSPETTGRQFEREYSHRVDALTEALDGLGSAERTEEQRGVWTVVGRDTVSERVVDLIDSAGDEVVFMTVSELLTDDVVARLRAASERGVSIKLAGMADSVEQDLRDGVPEADYFDSMWVWSDTPAGRMLMVDHEKTLVSVLVDGDGDHPPKPRDEAAIWGAGESNSLVVVLRAMFTWQLGETR
ncbi:TrmB family transcriptional regulator [Haloarcula nitratireducens]|uniref:TrmB family transcriptional regulator n=1 Tax=Haloarcula nitratireducens TaxID=2487749 RepID=A0AAW4PHT3_9EURY|nr:helix-turn-helix domain-containing protein [Halomicroarcula nitratireducens]MBX0297138.1 TrmB family transcriptional regulator [Halomicroarcula nitratireducens]